MTLSWRELKRFLTVSVAPRFADEVHETVHAFDLIGQVSRNWPKVIIILLDLMFARHL